MIDQKYAIIAHLDVLSALDGEAKCRLVLCDLEAGRVAGDLCVLSREWESRKDVFSIPTDDLTVAVPVAPSAEEEVERPAGDPPNDSTAPAVGSPAGNTDEQRRNVLLDRYKQLTDEQQRAFGALKIPRDDLDAIAKALEEVTSNKTLTTHGRCKSCRADILWARTVDGKSMPLDPVPVDDGNVWIVAGIAVISADKPPASCRIDGPYVSHFATCPNADEHRKVPDSDTSSRRAKPETEGRDLGGADYKALLTRGRGLDKELRDWLGEIADEAAAGDCDFRPGRRGEWLTVRRFELHRGLIVLAEWLSEPANDVIEAVAAAAGGKGTGTGRIVGSLNADQATQFALYADDVAAGRAHIEVNADERLTLVT